MGKKKQPDFQAVKLRVGKHLPKGRNVTNTSFKSKKIITKDQKFKTAPKDISLDELLRLLKHNNVPTKIDALKKIKNFVKNNVHTLSSFFADIINELGRVLLQDNIKVRKEAVDLLIYCLDSLSESQMYCFIAPLASYLDCMMTHVNSSIKKQSLLLLYGILNTHPNLICCYTKILFNLLNMISCLNNQQKDAKHRTKRTLVDTINDKVISGDFRDEVLKLIVEFLEKLKESFSKEETNESEQRVYWDGNQPLFIPLYAGSGLNPAKLEFYRIGQIKSESKISADLRSFLQEFIPLSSYIITEELVPTIVISNCNILHASNIRRLNTITQALCQLGDWFILNSDIECREDPEFLSLMNNIVCKKLMLRFPYTQQMYRVKKADKSSEEELHLNLGVCYLHNMFILGTNYSKEDVEKRIMQCLCTLCTKTKIEYIDIKSISLVLKNIKRFVEFSATNEGLAIRSAYESEISSILSCLCWYIVKYKNTTTAKLIESFFIKLSLDHEYKFLLSYEGMNEWIKYLFVQLKHMFLCKEVNKKLLKCINQICCREYPTFLKNLSTLASPEILEYMKFEDEDYQFTIMNFITHMTNLPSDFLQDVAELILCDNGLSTKTIVKFIRLLHHRFSEPNVRESDYLSFLTFLINVALDTISVEMENKETKNQLIIEDVRTVDEMEISVSLNEEGYNIAAKQSKLDLNYIRSLLKDIQDMCINRIMPSVLWERHSNICEVCIEYLLRDPRVEIVSQIIKSFISSLWQPSSLLLPVHSAIAFFKLIGGLSQQHLKCLYSKEFKHLYFELITSSLLYISVMTNNVPNDLLKSYNIGELQESLKLDKESLVQIFAEMKEIIYESGVDELKCFYVLRIFKFFVSKKYICGDDVRFKLMLQAIEETYPNDSSVRAELNDIHALLGSGQPK